MYILDDFQIFPSKSTLYFDLAGSWLMRISSWDFHSHLISNSILWLIRLCIVTCSSTFPFYPQPFLELPVTQLALSPNHVSDLEAQSPSELSMSDKTKSSGPLNPLYLYCPGLDFHWLCLEFLYNLHIDVSSSCLTHYYVGPGVNNLMEIWLFHSSLWTS